MTTAADTYAMGHATALELLAKLQEAIEEMPAPESIYVNWGYVGNISHINGQLRELLDFVGGDNA